MGTFAFNKRAGYDYELLDRYEAGLMLFGYEVKSVKTGHISLKGSFVTVHGGELYLTNALIPLYQHAGKMKGYEPSRSRKLLLKKSEISTIVGKIKARGLTAVPLRVYTKRRLLKLEFALGKGKKKHDKRETMKKRDDSRNIARSLKDH